MVRGCQALERISAQPGGARKRARLGYTERSCTSGLYSGSGLRPILRRAKHVGVWLADGDEGRKEKKEWRRRLRKRRTRRRKTTERTKTATAVRTRRVMMPMVMMTTMAMAMMMAPPTAVAWRGGGGGGSGGGRGRGVGADVVVKVDVVVMLLMVPARLTRPWDLPGCLAGILCTQNIPVTSLWRRPSESVSR